MRHSLITPEKRRRRGNIPGKCRTAYRWMLKQVQHDGGALTD